MLPQPKTPLYHHEDGMKSPTHANILFFSYHLPLLILMLILILISYSLARPIGCVPDPSNSFRISFQGSHCCLPVFLLKPTPNVLHSVFVYIQLFFLILCLDASTTFLSFSLSVPASDKSAI